MKKNIYISDFLLEELHLFFKDKNIEQTLNSYKKAGIRLTINSDSINVKTKNLTYTIGIIEENNILYWHLTPYKDTFYQTEFVPNSHQINDLLDMIKELN